MTASEVILDRKTTRRAGLGGLLAMTCLLHLAWTLWVILLVKFPHPLNATSVRLLARVIVWVVPAILYIKLVLREPLLRSPSLDRHLGRGIAWGIIGAMIPIAIMVGRIAHGSHWTTPHPADLWVNAIIAAPITEEVFFRGVLFTQVSRQAGSISGLLISSISFVLLHVPYWVIANDSHKGSLIEALARIFIFGIGFAMLLRVSRSLAAP